MTIDQSPIPNDQSVPVVMLGSTSPQRVALLSQLIPSERILIAAPLLSAEPGFDDCPTDASIRVRLLEIARLKQQSLRGEFEKSTADVLLTADTVIVATARGGAPRVLGKPDGADWQHRVRSWFEEFYLGREHAVRSAVCLCWRDGTCDEFVDETIVRMRPASSAEVDWYLATGEPLGKAGGYAIQGAGSLFVDEVRGSLSNVIGLPLEKLWGPLAACAPANSRCDPTPAAGRSPR